MYTDLLRPGGWPQVGAIVAIMGVIDAMFAPRLLKRRGTRKTGRRVKRFWKDVSVEPEGDGWAIRLDGRPMKTPARAALSVPSEPLADAIAEEWRGVGERSTRRRCR